MGSEQHNSGTDGTLATQAIVELTEANISANRGDTEWDEELGFLHDAATTSRDTFSEPEVGEVIDLSTLLA